MKQTKPENFGRYPSPEEGLAAVESLNRKVAGNPEKAREVLISIGVLDKDGNVTPYYRPVIKSSKNGRKPATSHRRVSRV